MNSVMMQCGHAANSLYHNKATGEKEPACVICAPDPAAHRPAAQAPNLDGRLASCSCGRTAASDPGRLAFFEYRGPGSRAATHCRHCHHAECAHDPAYIRAMDERSNRRRVAAGQPPWPVRKTVVERGECPGYEPRTEGRTTDSFYCGCRGWD